MPRTISIEVAEKWMVPAPSSCAISATWRCPVGL